MHARKVPLVVALAAFAAGSAAPAATITNPTPQRAYVSVHGLDTNSCGPDAPCRTLAMALTQVSPDGEVLVTDSGGFGLANITQGVTITAAPGVYAGMSVFPGNSGIVVNAAGANVTLRGLTVNSQGGDAGIVLQAAASLNIENCVVNGFLTTGATNWQGSGIYLNAAASVHVEGTTTSNNEFGIFADHGVTAVVSGSKALHNYGGIWVVPGSGYPQTSVAVDGTETSYNWVGVYVNANSSAARVNVLNSTSNYNGWAGYQASLSSVLTISSSAAIGNHSYGLLNTSATSLLSFGNNRMSDNGTPTGGTITSAGSTY